jgi:hypothetical protein
MTSIKKLPMMSITHSTIWLDVWADQTFEYTTIIQHFMVTNHPIMSSHFPPWNPISKRIKIANSRVILQLLHCRQFLLVHDLSSPSLIKGGLDTPYHATTGPNPSRYFHCIESMKHLLLCLQVLTSHWVPVPSLVPDDLATKILQTYPKFAERGIPMHPGCHPSWPLPRVCMYSVHTTGFSILLLYSEIFLMHRSQRVPWCAHDICRSIRQVWSRRHEERDRRANCHSATMPSSSPKIIRSGDFQSPPCCQSCVPRTYHYLCAILVYIPIANLWEYSRLFHTISAQPTIYDLLFIVVPIDSYRSILYLILALVLFLKPRGKAYNYLGIFLGPNAPKFTQIPSIFIPKILEKRRRF